MVELDLTKKYVLAVSGGVDSMTMLHIFSALSPRPNFSVITVNHNIRAQAQADCNFVEEYCQKLQVECRKVFVDVPKYASEHRLSEETAARILRYEVLDEADCDCVCLAHHKGDNAETVLMHIIRGSGSYGAEGIRRQNGKYLRPMLDWSRADIESYARENNVPYVHDSTNDETKYSRNYIRKVILPELKRLNPSAEQNIVRFADNIAEDNAYLDSLADISSVTFFEKQARIPLEIVKQPKPVAYRSLRKVFRALGIFYDIERTHIEALIALSDGDGGKQISLPFGYTAINDYDCITLTSANGQTYGFEIPFEVGKTVTPYGTVVVADRPPKIGEYLRFDIDAIPQDAVIRNKRKGDIFVKFGGGSKPLRRYLTDVKIPRRKRDALSIVASGNEALIICGVEISDKVKTTAASVEYYIWVEGAN